MQPSDALTTLGELAEQRLRDPSASLRGATEILAATGDPRVEAAACQLIGMAQFDLGQVSEAVATFRRSIETSVEHGLADTEATARAHLAPPLLALGDAAAAEEEITAAVALASPVNRGVVAARHGWVLQRTGRLNEAHVIYNRARRWLEETDDQAYLALVHLNQGILHGYQGSHESAVESLATAERIARARNLPVLVAMATHNMGFVLAQLGKLPDALAVFARAEDAYAALGNPGRLVAVLEADRGEVYLLAGLVAEAQAGTRLAVGALVAVGDQLHLMECRLLLARALLAGGDYAAAAAEATRAARGFAATARWPWAALAHYAAIQAEVLESEDGTPSLGLLRRCRRIAADLDAARWTVEAAHARTFAGRIALALGRPAVARAELAKAATARARGTADLRAQAWLADALLHLTEGDRGAAKRSLQRGMAVVDSHRASLGATELRVAAASHGADLARLGIQLALEDRRAADVLRWAERWRAGALRRPSVRPPDDERLARALIHLRQAQAELRAARLSPVDWQEGEPSAAAVDSALRSRIAELERAVRSHTLQARDSAVATGRVDVAAIRRALRDRWLVEYVAVGGRLHAVTVTSDRVRLHELGSASIAEEKQYLLFAIRRLMSSPGRRGAEQALAATAARLDEILLAPLGIPAVAPLIIVPTGLLHGLPWAALPSLAGRPVTVAPSAAMWLGDLGTRPTRATGHAVALVAGPQLPGADDEVAQVAAQYPSARTLIGPAATTAALLTALEEADVAHLAAHGSFRSDSPLFSSVLLADGPVTVYELERLSRAPRTVVLASCDAAVSAVHLGDELLGTAAALLGLGVRWVIAPVMPVPDKSTAGLMVALHRQLLAGDTPAAALAHARLGQDQAVAAAFICIGCDDAVSACDPRGDDRRAQGADAQPARARGGLEMESPQVIAAGGGGAMRRLENDWQGGGRRDGPNDPALFALELDIQVHAIGSEGKEAARLLTGVGAENHDRLVEERVG